MKLPLLMASLAVFLMATTVSASTVSASPYSAFIEARNLTSFRAAVKRGPVQGLALGNSIMAGGWVQLLTQAAPRLSITNAAVGGVQASQMGFVVAPVLPGDALSLKSALPNPALAGKKFAFVGGTRNEAGFYNTPELLKSERMVYEALIDALLAAGVEPIVFSDPPQVEMATGAIYPLSAVADPVMVKLQQEVARAKGVTFVNVWAQFMALKAAGQDIRPLYIDGTHPETPGRQMIAKMVAAALFTEPSSTVPRGAVSKSALAVAYPLGSNWKPPQDATTSPLSTTLSRGRSEVYALAAGESVSVLVPTAQLAWSDVMLQPRCSDLKVTLSLGSWQYQQAGCSGNDTSVHREQTDGLGSIQAGRMTFKNSTDRLMGVIGVLLLLDR
jgi:hypothetical protein